MKKTVAVNFLVAIVFGCASLAQAARTKQTARRGLRSSDWWPQLHRSAAQLKGSRQTALSPDNLSTTDPSLQLSVLNWFKMSAVERFYLLLLRRTQGELLTECDAWKAVYGLARELRSRDDDDSEKLLEQLSRVAPQVVKVLSK